MLARMHKKTDVAPDAQARQDESGTNDEGTMRRRSAGKRGELGRCFGKIATSPEVTGKHPGREECAGMKHLFGGRTRS